MDVMDSGENINNGQSIEGEPMDLNQLQGLFTEWLDSDVQDGIYRWDKTEKALVVSFKKARPLWFFKSSAGDIFGGLALRYKQCAGTYDILLQRVAAMQPY